jgi:shikimate kinase
VERVLLLGMMGAGKSTVGRAIAARTGWPYLDNDDLVARAYGRPTPEVLAEAGERGLREVESAALTEALAAPTPVVAGVAGGVVESAEDRQRLADADALVVWLRATVDTLVERVGSGAGRPWLAPDPRTALEALYRGRAAHYESVADLVLDVEGRSPEELAGAVLAVLAP